MMSSSAAIALASAHPEAAEHEPAAVGHRHPRLEPRAEEKITDQGERGDAHADRYKGVAGPQPRDDVNQHEIDRPERPQLARREIAEAAAKYSECQKQQECHQHPDIESEIGR